MMKKLSVMLFVLTTLATSSVAAWPAEQATDSTRRRPTTGSADLNPIDESGIRARIAFLDSGSPQNQLVVAGVATGLDPTQTYVTLVYDREAAFEGPLACVPSRTPSPLTSDQMIVGFWTVAPDGTGSLFAVKTGVSYVPLREVGAASIRVVLGPPPAGFVLQACGQVQANR
jgi:hypothetical protein